MCLVISSNIARKVVYFFITWSYSIAQLRPCCFVKILHKLALFASPWHVGLGVRTGCNPTRVKRLQKCRDGSSPRKSAYDKVGLLVPAWIPQIFANGIHHSVIQSQLHERHLNSNDRPT